MIVYFLAALAGLSLGLLGGGGSILAVPIMVYTANIPPKVAVAMSLAVVGVTTLFGVYGHYKAKNINIKLALQFGGAAIPSTFIGSYLSQLISGSTQLIIFSIVMILAAIFMFKGRSESETNNKNFVMTLISGSFVGVMTGLIGVGGGFLIVPALMYFTGTKIKQAVGTSLLIISLNSLIGFLSYLDKVQINWAFMSKFTVASIVGILIGAKLVPYIPAQKLKKAFAIFLILMGIFILYKNLGSL